MNKVNKALLLALIGRLENLPVLIRGGINEHPSQVIEQVVSSAKELLEEEPELFKCSACSGYFQANLVNDTQIDEERVCYSCTTLRKDARRCE